MDDIAQTEGAMEDALEVIKKCDAFLQKLVRSREKLLFA